MSVHWPIESAYGKEQARWNTPRNKFLVDSNGELMRDADGHFIKGMNTTGYEEYPRMMFKAHRLPNGQPSAGEIPPHPAFTFSREEYEQRCAYVDQFNRECQRLVNDEAEERIAKGQGWARTTKEALELYEKEQQAIARAAAEAEFYSRRMTKKAQREWQAAQDETAEHVVDVTSVPKRRRGRPKKTTAVAPMAGSIPPRPGSAPPQ